MRFFNVIEFLLIGGKWKLHILFWLWRKDVMRYSELKKALHELCKWGVEHIDEITD